MADRLSQITIRGYKSIASLDDFPLDAVNVLIGANGAGKSNFVDVFRLLRAAADGHLQSFMLEHGGADGFFFMGPKATPRLSFRFEFGFNDYELELKPTVDSGAQIKETALFSGGPGQSAMSVITDWAREAVLSKRVERIATEHPELWQQYKSISRWEVYHFHDTSSLAPMRRDQSLRDFERLRPDASNIAPFLHRLRSSHRPHYDLIRDTIRSIAPFFDDFLLRPLEQGGEEKLRLEWTQTGSDFPFQPYQLSDGTLRFICLATALLQPKPPTMLVIDEPELGLHPFAITMLAEMIRAASQRTQLIVSTQSPQLVDHFDPADIVAVSREDGRSKFERLDPAALQEWLRDYTVGELWQKNVIRAGPDRA